MKNHACIAIGINQYQFLQPLSYAQEDAEALHDFWVEEAAFLSEGCVLLTDSSPTQEGKSTYPNQENILQFIENWGSAQVQRVDLLWFFFSGYGVSYQGQDYLMPIDGNPSEVERTGISMLSLLTTLKRLPAQSVMVLLDINRSQGMKAGDGVGIETEDLARQMEIPTILSCRHNQVSRETSSLRQGFFTATLLEGLRSGQGSTIRSLERFLSERLPQLCDHHLRPKQEPLVIASPSQLEQEILPVVGQLVAATAMTRNGSNAAGADADGLGQSQNLTAPLVSLPSQEGAAVGNPQPPQQLPATPARIPAGSPDPQPAGGDSVKTNSARPENTEMSDKSFLQQLILWSGGVALVLLLGVFLTNQSVFLGRRGGGTGSNVASAPGTSTDPTTIPTQPLVPQPVNDKPAANGQTSNRQLWAEAKALLKNSSASSFSNAIAKARQIPPSDPLYPQAQADIQRWSWTIFDIANGRAAQADFSGAISAAKLVPTANQELRSQAQQAIAKWQSLADQQQKNTATLTAARKQIQRGVASSYSKAIEQVSTIKAGQPKYEEAQQLMNEWSTTIFNMAELRASQGRFQQAIEAATLVPKGTTSYNAAQKSMTTWKERVARQRR